MAQQKVNDYFSERNSNSIDINDFDASIETIKTTMNKNSINKEIFE